MTAATTSTTATTTTATSGLKASDVDVFVFVVVVVVGWECWWPKLWHHMTYNVCLVLPTAFTNTHK